MAYLNFEEQIVFYGQYHNNIWNRTIHIIFVPILFWSFMVAVAKAPTLILFNQFPFNLSFALTFVYIFYYILLEPVAGAVFAPFLLMLTYAANVFALKSHHAWAIFAVVQLAGWSAQLLGHSLFEKRTPAFLDNLVQAFLMAPLFVFLELLFVLGYRPSLHKRIREKIKSAIGTWKLSKERRISSESNSPTFETYPAKHD